MAESIKDTILRVVFEDESDYSAQVDEIRTELLRFIRKYKGRQLTEEVLTDEAEAIVQLVLLTRGLLEEDDTMKAEEE